MAVVVCCALTTYSLALAEPPETTGKRPIPLIFDTDIGNDVDDVLALGVIHALESRGECELLAVTITKDNPLSAPFVDAVNSFYGRGDIPIGVVHNGPTPEASKFTSLANQKDGGEWRYPHKLVSGGDAPEAVALLRRTLAKAEDGTVVVVQVGFSTNLALLLTCPPDEISALSGIDLVRKKVRLLSVMAGSFAAPVQHAQAEYNIAKDIRSAQTLVSKWPTPIVFSGYEVGLAVTFPAASIERDFAYVPHHPLAEAYNLYMPPPHERPTWDLTSVLYAVRPERGYFELSPPGRVSVAGDGTTSFQPDQAGPHRFLILNADQKIRVREALAQLASEPPSRTLENRPPAAANPPAMNRSSSSGAAPQSPPVQAGVGIALRIDDGKVFVNKVLTGTPADRSQEIRANDQVTAIAEAGEKPIDVSGIKDVSKAVGMIRGPLGSIVHLTIIPAGRDKNDQLVVSLERGNIKEINTFADGRLLPLGSLAPNFKFISLRDVKETDLSAFAGRIVVVEFWASWCGPCIKAADDLESVQEKHPEWTGKVAVLAVSVDEKQDDAAALLSTKNWPKIAPVWAGLDVLKAYRVSGLPTVFVIDRDGRVAAVDHRLDVPAVIDSLLRK